WPGDGGTFALVFSGQAWHWLDPSVRLAHAHDLLRERGAVALVWNQPSYPDVGLRSALDDAYDELAPGTIGRFGRGPRPDGPGVAIEELRASERFDGFERHEHRHTVTYDVGAYLELLDTHSDH